MDFQDLESLIKTRRSIRLWKQERVPEDSILKAIELGTWAPNGGNRQNWKFIVITNRDLINQMADAFQSMVDKIASWPEAIKFGEPVNRWKRKGAFFRYAPVCIAALMANYESLADQILNLRMERDQSAQALINVRRMGNSGLQSIAANISYLLLALHLQKLGAVWMTGPLLAKVEIEDLLQVPKGMNLVALIAVGFPDEEPTQRRRPLPEVVEFLR